MKPASKVEPSPPESPGKNCGRPAKSPDVPLPVLAAGEPPSGIKPSSNSRWRAMSLILVHVFMISHALHWLYRGETVTPIEPSESMQTIISGQVNAGFIFFALAILATFVLGRWLCGWGCHLVAYQDLTLWVLKKLRLRPKAFRSRFLIFIPLLAALYMFIWPIVGRWLFGAPAPHWSWHLKTTEFWATFPSYGVAALTVLVCGVAIIYLLGPKGFCTYACPYGGFFALADRFAPSRIRVTDACQQCGHCTATCTSNVDVAQEVKLYKMVVDPGCMKCLDCVSVCPNHALYYGWGAPSLLRRPAAAPRNRAYDLSLGEELVALGLFAGSFMAVRGLYGVIPFLLSLGIAGVITFLLMKALWLLGSRDVLIQRVRLKVAGRLRPAGWAHLVFCAALVAFLVHSGLWRYHDYAGERAFDRSPEERFGWQYAGKPRLSAEASAVVTSGIAHLETCARIGLFRDELNELKLAWLYAQDGRPEDAAALVSDVLKRRPDDPFDWLKLAKLQTAAGQLQAARESFDRCLALEARRRAEWARKLKDRPNPLSAELFAEWGAFLSYVGEPDAAQAALAWAASYDRESLTAQLAYAAFLEHINRFDEARRTLLTALQIAPRSETVLASLSRIGKQVQDYSAAAEDYSAALQKAPGSARLHANLGYCFTALREYPEAVAAYRKALEVDSSLLDARADLGAVLMILGDFAGAAGEYERVVEQAPENVEAALRLAYLYVQLNESQAAVPLLERAAATGSPDERRVANEMLLQLKARGGSR